MCTRLIHAAVRQKLTQHRKATIVKQKWTLGIKSVKAKADPGLPCTRVSAGF